MHTRRRSRTSSSFTSLAALVLGAALLPAACGPIDATPDLDTDFGAAGALINTDGLEDQVLKILRALFPALSEDELVELKASISLEDALALQAELEAVRDEVVEFSDNLFKTAEERVEERKADLAPVNDGFPEGVEAVGRVCLYDEANARGSVSLSGVFDGKESVLLTESDVVLTVGGQPQPFTLECLHGDSSVDVVFLVDITGSMSNVIHSVRNSVANFVDALQSSGIEGTVSVVTFQDSVGVNTTFQERAPSGGFERSPFFEPVSLSDAAGVDSARSFINRLEANRGADASENLAAAIDFARNNVIGYMANGSPNVIGDGKEDPAGTQAFPKLTSDRQVFVALTDITFHGDGHSASNSSLLAPFEPRDKADILESLQATGTMVHVSDPSWVDDSLDPTDGDVDADYWAMHTGGLGEDRVLGYSLVDLELVVVAEETGLLDITLDKILGSTCSLEFDGSVATGAEVNLSIDLGGTKQFSTALAVERY
jgi:hypothetical protein